MPSDTNWSVKGDIIMVDDDFDSDDWCIYVSYDDDADDDDGWVLTVMTAVRKIFAATWATVGRKPADVETRLLPDGG